MGSTAKRRHVTGSDIAALPIVLDPVTAGRMLGIGRTSTYRLLETGEFPAPAFRAGKQWRIPTAGICALLGIPYPPPDDKPGCGRADTTPDCEK
ncbi:excisionase family DNA binding protein [Streptomonospora nanhaiensis]|uniref:Excisionase family DNA binding protein n=1 Tax=Streptomonospora nanhaiensis TaxID=1323731 RepID=A0A853BUZ9_9ACTN|nr:excisionase family DNA binding protein [Streptomonospora nanhaiensis]